MSQPLVSVILPIYNCEPYLREAVESILTQTYSNIEVIAINDGSTDQSAAVLASFAHDSRVRYFENGSNKGLIFTLNRGIELAKGELIARMDGDDICFSDRIASQVNFMEQAPAIAVVATRIRLIDEKGGDLGTWKEEYERTTAGSIHSYLRWNNCIAHPTIMARSTVMAQFRYDPRQPLSEDYDLWLRISAAGLKIAKLESIGVKHRILSGSFTRTRSYNAFTRMARVKRIFVAGQLRNGKINSFVITTAFTALIYWVAGVLKGIKGRIAA